MSLFTLDGRSLEEFGLIALRGHQYPMQPESVDVTLAVPNRHGLYDLGSTLGPRKFAFPLMFPYETDRYRLQQRMRAFSAFLLDSTGRPREMKLSLSYEPGVYYAVKAVGGITPDRLHNQASFTLTLIAYDPFPHTIDDSLTTTTWDTDLTWDTISLSWSDDFTFDINGDQTISINNFGLLNIRPEIHITGSFETIAFDANDQLLQYNTALSGSTLIIDNRRMTIREDNTNRLKHMSGDFIEFVPGYNQVTVSGTGLNCTVEFVFRAVYPA